MRALALVTIFACLSGCASTYATREIVAPDVKLQKDRSVAIAVPENGAYGGREYSSSGRATALAVRAAFASYSSDTTVISACKSLRCLKEQAPFATYFVVPEILRWEDRVTEWSGKKDKIEVKLSIFGSENEESLASTVLSGKSKWATFGGDHPEDLLPIATKNFVESLY